jgi:hypothetical protein
LYRRRTALVGSQEGPAAAAAADERAAPKILLGEGNCDLIVERRGAVSGERERRTCFIFDLMHKKND